MAFLDFIKKLQKEEHENTKAYKKMLKERECFKASIRQNLQKMNFTEEEVEEVFFLIEKSYNQLEEAKKPLINITPNDILNKVEDEVKANIKRISEHMLEELKDKVREIQARKK